MSSREGHRQKLEPPQERGHVGCNHQVHRGQGAHIYLELALGAGHEAIGFNICPARFQSHFGLILFYSSISPFWNENAYPMLL